MALPSDVNPAYKDNKTSLINRMRRIEGQTRGIEKMIDDNKYCIDILNQITAARTALDKVAMSIVNDHIHHCVKEALTTGDQVEIDNKTRELIEVIDGSCQRFWDTQLIL